jgi:hypothetical protein
MSFLGETTAEFERETHSIWLQCPAEITLLGAGRAERPTGSRGQYLTPVLFAESSTRLFADEVLWGVLHSIERVGLDVATIAYMAGEAARRKSEFYEFIDLKHLAKMASLYVKGLQACQNADEIGSLTKAALAYFNRVHVWLDSVVPWEICDAYPLQSGLRPAYRS